MKIKKAKCLFICKRRLNSYGVPIGLINSAAFVVNALIEQGHEAQLVCVQDFNAIDREIALYKPTHCFIEAIWVTPAKMEELCGLHKTVKFVVRVHSKIPFLAQEGIAMQWIIDYGNIDKRVGNLRVSANSQDLHDDLKDILKIDSVYLPNIYMPVKVSRPEKEDDEVHYDNDYRRGCGCGDTKVINIGCFGAIRQLKNHLIQAFAAIEFANKSDRRLRFHINANRLEGPGADSILKNLRALFSSPQPNGVQHELVEHDWVPHEDFIKLIQQMDIGMQVSFSESFNIVIADFIANNIPVVASPDVDWISGMSQANPNSTEDIVDKLRRAWRGGIFNLQHANTVALERHNRNAVTAWTGFLKS